MNRKKVKEQVKAIMDSKSLTEAYMKTHNCSQDTAKKHAYRMLRNPEILAELEKQMDAVRPIDVNKTNLVKMLTMVIQNWQEGVEKTADFLRAVEILSRLVPDFSEKKSIETYTNLDDKALNDEITTRLKRMGLS